MCRYLIYILLFVFVSLQSGIVYAQVVVDDANQGYSEADSVKTEAVADNDELNVEDDDKGDSDEAIVMTEESDSLRRADFNAMNYLMLKRYRPDYKRFDNSHFYNNMFISIDGGIRGFIPRDGESRFLLGNRFRLLLSKYFNPYSGLRLYGSYAGTKREWDRSDLRIYSVGADYLFNISSYIGGFDPERLFEFVSIQGIGGNISSLNGLKGVSADLHWGIQAKMNLGQRVELYVEPGIDFLLGNAMPNEEGRERNSNVGYYALFGLNYRLGHAYRTETDSIYSTDGFFFSFAGGVQAQNSFFTRNMGLRYALGPSLEFSFGKWLIPQLGMKLTAFATADSWRPIDTEVMDFNRLAAYGGGRLEFIANPLKFFSRTSDSRFTVEPSAGIEFGLGFKQDNNLRKVSYLGFTGAIQFKYKVGEDVAFFVEPRYSRVPYELVQLNVINELTETPFVDNVFSLNFGVEVSSAAKGNRKSQTHANNGFVPHMTFSSGVGPAMVVQQRHYYRRTIGHSSTFGLGYLFNPVSGLRADLNIGTVTSHMPQSLSQSFASVSLNYTIDLTSLFNSYDADRRWSVEMFGGPMIGGVSDNFTKKKAAFGIQAGGRISYKVSSDFDFYVEPRMYGFTRRLFPMLSGSPGIAAVGLGGTYHFMYRNRKIPAASAPGGFFDNTFAGFSVGTATSLNSLGSDNRAIARFGAMGSDYRFYIGKWLNPYFGVRASASACFYSYSLSNDDSERDKVQSLAGAGIEFMFNPFRVVDADTRYMFELVPVTGLQVRKLSKQMDGDYVDSKAVTSLSAALQLRYNATENISVVLEPSYSRVPYSLAAGTFVNDMMSVSLGVEMRHSELGSIKKSYKMLKDYDRYWFVSVNGGLNSNLEYRKNGKSCKGYIIEALGGYSFTPLSSARLGIDYTQLNMDNVNMRNYSLSLNYMFNIGNIVGGYVDRNIDVYLFAGPVFSVKDYDEVLFGAGGEVGALVNIKAYKNLYVNIQPKMRIYSEKFSNEDKGDLPLNFSLSAGLTYHF